MIYIEVLNKEWDPAKAENLTGLKAYLYNKKMAKEYVEAIKKNINTQKFNYPPLSRQYLIYKRRKGYSLKKVFLTLTESIDLRVYSKGVKSFTVGFRGKRYHSGEKVKSVAKRLEYGTHTIPPRPLFRDTLKSMDSVKVKKTFLSLLFGGEVDESNSLR